MARPTADDGAERLREENRRLHARLADLEAEVYDRAGSGVYAAGSSVRAPAYRAESVTDARDYRASVFEGASSAPARFADAAGVLLRGVSVSLIRQVEFGVDIVGSFADAILGRPVDPFLSQRSRGPETSELLGRWR